jgi:hypothetical protein
VNLCIPHNRRTPLQAEEALGPISIPRGSCGVDPFQRTSASRAEKPGAYSTPGTPSMEQVVLTRCRIGHSRLTHSYLLNNEERPECIPYNPNFSLKHVLIDCVAVIPRGSCGVDPFQRTSASRAEKPGAYSTPGTPSMRGVVQIKETLKR